MEELGRILNRFGGEVTVRGGSVGKGLLVVEGEGP